LWLRCRTLALNQVMKALDRYLYDRTRHKDADLPWLLLGPKGRLTDSGIYQMIERRSKKRRSRPSTGTSSGHTYAHLFLSIGGQEQDLSVTRVGAHRRWWHATRLPLVRSGRGQRIDDWHRGGHLRVE
jgi:hypothetical protein